MSINTNRQNNAITIILTSILTSILTVAFSYMYAEYKANQILKQTGVSADSNEEAALAPSLQKQNKEDVAIKVETDLKGFPDVHVGMFAENDLIKISKHIGDMLWVHPNGKIFHVFRDGVIDRVISPGHRDYNAIKTSGDGFYHGKD